jgi:hypothetical protein
VQVGSVWRGDWAPEDPAYYQEILNWIYAADEVVLAGPLSKRGPKHNSCEFLERKLRRSRPHMAKKVLHRNTTTTDSVLTVVCAF